MKMNLPNRLTLLRVILIPFFIVFYMTELIPQPYGRYVALVIFILASYTDHLDGKIARSRNIVTNFGKFMDPLADKLLVCSACICFIEKGKIAAWIVIIMIAREFIISGFRLLAATNGVVIAAGIWGKIKTVVQMCMIIAILIDLPYFWFYIIEQVLIYASMALSVFSVTDYIIKNIGVFREDDAKE